VFLKTYTTNPSGEEVKYEVTGKLESNEELAMTRQKGEPLNTIPGGTWMPIMMGVHRTPEIFL